MISLVRILILVALAVQARGAVGPIPEGFPETWGVREGKAVPAYYTMTTNQAVAAALRALPSVFVRMKMDDLFGAERGIYSHPMESGSDWERAASIEMTPWEERAGFKEDCGIRIQGGWNRRPEESPKHAFRIVFKKKYGAGKLRAPLFDGAAPQVFDELILRAGCNNSWLHWSGEERKRGDYIRDQWMRDSYHAMGHASARGEFVHLYLNGVYWGLYNLTERPAAAFAAAHFGGKDDDYDARNADNILSGDKEAWERMFALANAGLKNAESFQAISQFLDVSAFADFMLLNYYGGNADWDGERTLEDPNANSFAADDDLSPTRLFHRLKENAEFRKLFSERAGLHLQGALAPDAAAKRFRDLADGLRIPILAEAARWGAYRHDVHQYKTGPYEIYRRESHWEPEVQRVITEFFPNRNKAFLLQLEKAGLILRK